MRYNPNKDEGLTSEQVEKRYCEGLVNYDTTPKTKSIKEIFITNIVTYFNILNLILAILIIIAGAIGGELLLSIKNCLFLGVVICNTAIGIIQEIKSKKIIDKLSVLTAPKVTVIRDKKNQVISQEELVLDDIVLLKSGDQVVTDTIIIDGEVEVNESFLTGEEQPVLKEKNNLILSGSFIISGNCIGKVEHIQDDNYIAKISKSAHYHKKINSVILDSFNKLLKLVSVIIIPLGIILFISQIIINNNFVTASFKTVAAIIGMIPEGLILLTSSIMAVSTIRLSKYNVLIQQLYCIETLARVNTICLDKTGTITEGKMELKEIIPISENKQAIEKYLIMFAGSITDTNATIKAIKQKYFQYKIPNVKTIPFSSQRKFSAVQIDNQCLYLGAPEILLKDKHNESETQKYQEAFRVLVLAKSNQLDKEPSNLKPLAYLLIQDKIRPDAKETLDYFRSQGTNIKILSGDNLKTVMSIAKRAGLSNVKGVDFTLLTEEELLDAVKKYDIFARITPEGKRKIIELLKKQDHTVAFMGDGVNDVLALKEADCSISVAEGSEAARNISEIVLLDSNFNALPKVLLEGRRTINNLERSSSLLLSKTIFTTLLIIMCIVTAKTYYFIPIQLTLVTFFTIGWPSLLLALEPNKEIVTGNFLLKIIKRSLTPALTVTIMVFLISMLNIENKTTISVLITATVGFIYLYKICQPFSKYRIVIYIILLFGFVYTSLFQYQFFELTKLHSKDIIIYLILFVITNLVFILINNTIKKLNIFKERK